MILASPTYNHPNCFHDHQMQYVKLAKLQKIYPNPRGSRASIPRGMDCRLASTFGPSADAFFSKVATTDATLVSLISRTLRASLRIKKEKECESPNKGFPCLLHGRNFYNVIAMKYINTMQ